MTFQITIADASHVEQLFEMEKICFPDECWSIGSVKSEFSKENSICLIALCEGDFAGYAFSSFVYDESELNRIAVLPKYRNKKIAISMLEYLIEYMTKNNCKTLFLEVRENNKTAINLYKKAGFNTIGIRNNYYTNPTENAILMSLEL